MGRAQTAKLNGAAYNLKREDLLNTANGAIADIDSVLAENDALQQLRQAESIDPEIIEALRTGNTSGGYNPIDDFQRKQLGISSPSKDLNEKVKPSAFTPTIGSPEPQKTSPEKNTSSLSSGPTSSEARKLSDIINQERGAIVDGIKAESDSLKKQKLGKLNVKGRVKRRIRLAILSLVLAGAAAVPVGVIGVIPHAIQSWISGRTSQFAERASEQMGQKLLYTFFRDRVAVGKCKAAYSAAGNTAGLATCRPRLNERDGRISQLFNDWKAADMEGRLVANGINVEIDAASSGTKTKPYKVTIDGVNFELGSFDSPDWDISTFTGRRETARLLNPKLKEVLKKETHWWQFLKRRNLKAGYLRDLGLPARMFLPKSLDQRLDNRRERIETRHSRFRQHLTRHVVGTGLERVSIFMEILSGDFDKADPKKALENNKRIRVSALSKPDSEVIEMIQKYANKDLGRISREVFAEILSKLLSKIGIQVGSQSISKAIPIVGWVLLVFAILDMIDLATNGTLQKYLSMTNAQSMLDMSNYMNTVISEEKRGFVDLQSSGDMRLSMINGLSSSRVFTNTVGYQSSSGKKAAGYSCRPNVSLSDIGGLFDTASTIFTGEDVAEENMRGMQEDEDACENHRVDYDPLSSFGDVSNLVQWVVEPYTKQCIATHFIPGGRWIPTDFPPLIDCPSLQEVYHGLNGGISWFADKIGLDSLLERVMSFPPFRYITSTALGWLGSAASVFVTGSGLAGPELLQGGLNSESKSGARIFDSMYGGSSVMQNSFTKGAGDGGGLGGVTITPAQASKLNRSIAEDRKEELRTASIFERMFDISKPDTLASGVLATAVVDGGFTNFINPMSNVAKLFDSSSPSALAGSPDQAYCSNSDRFGRAVDEFGVLCYAVPDEFINNLTEEDLNNYSDPEFCESYTSDMNDLIESRGESSGIPGENQDPDGSGSSFEFNPCRLICTVTDATGTIFRENDPICGFESQENVSSGPSSAQPGQSGAVVGDTFDTPCAPGTVDAATTLSSGEAEGWSNGERYRIRLCSIPGFTSSGSDDSNDGLAKFNSTISGSIKDMFDKAQSEGITLSASSTFRSNEKQAQLFSCAPACTNGNPAARPGYSNHQMGFALDFSTGGTSYQWMRQNSEAFGLRWYGNGDPVHFSTTGG
jgi:hypothetical protein